MFPTGSLSMRNISKDFSGVPALTGVSIAAEPGEIHAIVGENGAGKSTLMKTLSGFYPHGSYTGEILLDDIPQVFRDTKDSERAGIAIIYQELALVPDLTIAENLFLGHEHTGQGCLSRWVMAWDKTMEAAQDLLAQVGLELPCDRKVKDLGVGEQQLVEIAKALGKKARILILDEPTAALTESESLRLLAILRQLKAKGVTCLYISHRLHEVLSIADRITVMRDGQTIETRPNRDLDEEGLVRMMVGRKLTERYPHRSRPVGPVMLEVEDWTVRRPGGRRLALDGISFSVRAGEILGIAGLMGAGRTELMTSIFGVFGPKPSRGHLMIQGQPVTIRSAQEAIDAGLAYVSEDRKHYGLVLNMNVARNTTLASLRQFARHGVLDEDQEARASAELRTRLKTKAQSLEQKVSTLSGGNQQKVVLAKWLLTRPKILILDEPTRGIDVLAKYEIYNIMLDLAAEGVAIVMVSSDLAEILGMSDRILVMHEGRISGELGRSQASQEAIMALATGTTTPH